MPRRVTFAERLSTGRFEGTPTSGCGYAVLLVTVVTVAIGYDGVNTGLVSCPGEWAPTRGRFVKTR